MLACVLLKCEYSSIISTHSIIVKPVQGVRKHSSYRYFYGVMSSRLVPRRVVSSPAVILSRPSGWFRPSFNEIYVAFLCFARSFYTTCYFTSASSRSISEQCDTLFLPIMVFYHPLNLTRFPSHLRCAANFPPS